MKTVMKLCRDMFRKQNYLMLITATIAGIEIANGLLINIATNAIPDSWKPYLGLSWPLLAILSLIAFGLKKALSRASASEEPATQSANPTIPKTSGGETDKQSIVPPSARKEPGRVPLPSLPKTLIQTNQTWQVAPLPLFDDSEPRGTSEIHTPLPQKPPRPVEISPKEKITSLPIAEAKVQRSMRLPEKPRTLYWSPDGTFIACIFREHAPLLIGADETIEVPVQEPVQALCWSPDSQMVAISTQERLCIWHMMRKEMITPPLPVDKGPIQDLDWSARGQLALWANSKLQLFAPPDFGSPSVLSLPHLQCQHINILRWSPDGALLAGVCKENGLLICWHVDQQISSVLSSRSQILTLAWLPGSSLLTVAFGNKLVLYDADKNHHLKAWERFPVAPRTLSISARKQLAIASISKDVISGSLDDELFPSVKYPGYWIALWSPTGRELATLDPQKETTLMILSIPQV